LSREVAGLASVSLL